MKLNFNSETPLYLQIAAELEDGILSGAFPEETQAPSTTELSVGYQINPATVLKGVNLLVDTGILYKKRGLGMFVAGGAVHALQEKRRREFAACYVRPLVEEALRLGLNKAEILAMIERELEHEQN